MGRVLQILLFTESDPTWRGDGHPFPWSQEHRQTYSLGLPQAIGLLGLWLYRVCHPRCRTRRTGGSRLRSGSERSTGCLTNTLASSATCCSRIKFPDSTANTDLIRSIGARLTFVFAGKTEVSSDTKRIDQDCNHISTLLPVVTESTGRSRPRVFEKFP
jgi:hypothetical protein